MRLLKLAESDRIRIALFVNRTLAAVREHAGLRLLAVLVVAGAAFTLVVWPAFALGAAYVWPLVSRVDSARVWRDFERAANRARGVAIVDSAGRYIGVLSSGFEPDHLGELPRPERYGGYLLYPDHKTIPVADAPEYFWRCLVFLEDRRRGSADSPFGVSFRGTVMIPYRSLAASIAAGRPRMGAGGSTLEMQLARSIWKRYAHNSNPVLRKLAEWNAAPVLRRRLGGEADSRRLRAWIAQHVALAQSVGDEQDLFGVDAAGRYLFGKPAEALAPAEQLLLAAAVRRPIRLRAEPERRAAEIESLVGTAESPGRALRCAGEQAVLRDGAPVIPDAAERLEAQHHLLDLPTDEMPYIHPDLEPFAATLIAHDAGARLGPQRLAARLAYGVQTELVGALADQLDTGRDDLRHPWRGRVSEIELTFDMVDNLTLEAAIDGAVERVERGGASGGRPRLLPGTIGSPERWRDGLDPASDAARRVPFLRRNGAHVPLTLAIADDSGRLVRLVNTGQDANYMGGARQRRNVGYFGNGRYEPQTEPRMIASIGKVAAALLLAEAGVGSVRQEVSNRCPLGISGQSRCMDPRSYSGGYPRVTLEKAFAESLNAAVINTLAARVRPARIHELMDALGFALPAIDAETPAATNLTLGRYTARPMTVHLLMMVALAYAREDYDAEITPPHMIERWRRFDPDTDSFLDDGPAPFPTRSVRVSDLLAPGGGAFVRDALAAPICYRDGDGLASLRALRAWCPGENPDVVLHIAKTGTVPAQPRDGFDESDWWVAGGIELADGRTFTYVASVGVGDVTLPFAYELGAARLAPVIDAALRDLTSEPDGELLTAGEL